jgi:two-component system OmpR family response regulator
MLILVVEDDPSLSGLVCEALRDALYAVDLAIDGEAAAQLMAVNSYDLVVLDWSIPPPTGIDLLRQWRREGSQVPVLMLTGRDTVEDKAGGLDIGADDYLTKPFSFRELLARVRSLLRRQAPRKFQIKRAGNLRFHTATGQVVVDGKILSLSVKEQELLCYLLDRCDEVVSRREIEDNVWDSAFNSTANVVAVTIFRLRQKIDSGAVGKLLHTVRGKGYMLKSERG